MAIIGQLTITTEDGITLAALNDLRLAWEWAENVYRRRVVLHALRRAVRGRRHRSGQDPRSFFNEG